MDFETWWAKQTANFDPDEIGLMQLARVTWNAAQDIEREACAKVCESVPKFGAYMSDMPVQDKCAASIRARSNADLSHGATSGPQTNESPTLAPLARRNG
jgi:hypothetical protein